MKRFGTWITLTALGALLATMVAPALAIEPLGQFVPHSAKGGVYTIVNEKGETLSKMALSVSPGDYLVTEDNRGWRVVSVKGRTATAQFDKVVDLSAKDDHPPVTEVITGWIGNILAQATGGPKKTVGVYHTHSDESYQPTTGKTSMNFGDIYKVGDTLVAGLRAKGFRVVHSYNNHNPHDASAYIRSRRTVAELMRSRPVSVIDVHRDAIPDANYYKRDVAGREIAAVRLVVGKQNANRAVNFDFAKKIKADASQIHPGLVREIFWAKGNYNQDVSPRSILLEFGTHLNSEKDARGGAALMADVLPVAITGRATAGRATSQGRATPGNPSSPELVGSQSRSGGSTVLWIVLIVLGGGALFLALNARSGGIGRQLKKFAGQELSGFLGRYRKSREKTGGAEGDRKENDEKRPGGDGSGDGTGPAPS